jgi:hypothetical protein
MTVTGKLCRNPFSTIKLPHEDGGSKAGFGLVSLARADQHLREHTIFDSDNFGFVAARSGAVYSVGLGRERDSYGLA